MTTHREKKDVKNARKEEKRKFKFVRICNKLFKGHIHKRKRIGEFFSSSSPCYVKIHIIFKRFHCENIEHLFTFILAFKCFF